MIDVEKLAAMKIPDFVAKLDEHESRCRSCKAPIVWCVTKRGVKMPLDLSGTSHFATCPNADKHRMKR